MITKGREEFLADSECKRSESMALWQPRVTELWLALGGRGFCRTVRTAGSSIARDDRTRKTRTEADCFGRGQPSSSLPVLFRVAARPCFFHSVMLYWRQHLTNPSKDWSLATRDKEKRRLTIPWVVRNLLAVEDSQRATGKAMGKRADRKRRWCGGWGI